MRDGEGERLGVSVSMSLSSPWPYLTLRNTREGFMPDEPLEKGAGRVSRGCRSLRLKQSDEYYDKKWTGKRRVTSSAASLSLFLFLLSVLFSSTELNALAMKREITLGRSCRQEDFFFFKLNEYTALADMQTLSSEILHKSTPSNSVYKTRHSARGNSVMSSLSLEEFS